MRRLHDHNPISTERLGGPSCGALPFGLAALLAVAGCRSMAPDARMAERLQEINRTSVELPDTAYRGPLTLAAAIERATAASEDVAMLVASVEVASKEKLVAGDWKDPELRLSYGEADDDGSRSKLVTQSLPVGAPGTTLGGGPEAATSTQTSSGYDVALRVFPQNPWARRQRVSAGTAGIYASVADLLDEQWRLENNVRRLFLQIHYLSERLEAHRELTEVYREALRISQELADQGHGTVADVMSASRRYLEALSDRDRTLRDLDAARRELASMVAMPFDDIHVVITPDLLADLRIDGIDAELLEQKALNQRRDLSALYWRRAQAESAWREMRASRTPWFSYVQASYGQRDSESDESASETDTSLSGITRQEDTVESSESSRDEWRVDAGITLPIFPGSNHESALRFAEYRRAELMEVKAKERAQREIMDALAGVKAAVAARERYQRETLPVTKDMEAMLVRVQAQSGLDPIETARLREQILEARRIELEAGMGFHLAVVSLEEAIGMRLNDVLNVPAAK